MATLSKADALPAKEGWYWWTPIISVTPQTKEVEWLAKFLRDVYTHPVHVVSRGKKLWAFCEGVGWRLPHRYWLAWRDEHLPGPMERTQIGGGEWGERIPDSDTLTAMRELVRLPHVYHGPDVALPGAGKRLTCLACGATARVNTWANQPKDVPHRPDCPWLRAQENAHGRIEQG